MEKEGRVQEEKGKGRGGGREGGVRFSGNLGPVGEVARLI